MILVPALTYHQRMETTYLDEPLRRQLLAFQKDELTEYHVYKKLASSVRSAHNREVLERIAEDELRHARRWAALTKEDVHPDRWQFWKYYLISRVFGFTFGVKLMERGEQLASQTYSELSGVVEAAAVLAREEQEHEKELLGLLDEERLRYAGSVVLGLNDALVELTGALAGLTLALQNTKLVALTGSITGIAAALSMSASEYLSTRSETTGRHPLKAAIYTGSAYLATVSILILPYLLLTDYYASLALTLAGAVIVIATFNYYISVAKGEPFRRRFLEMAALSFGVAALSFGLGYVLRTFLGVEM